MFSNSEFIIYHIFFIYHIHIRIPTSRNLISGSSLIKLPVYHCNEGVCVFELNVRQTFLWYVAVLRCRERQTEYIQAMTNGVEALYMF